MQVGARVSQTSVWTATPGVWRHAGVRFLLSGELEHTQEYMDSNESEPEISNQSNYIYSKPKLTLSLNPNPKLNGGANLNRNVKLNVNAAPNLKVSFNVNLISGLNFYALSQSES